MQPTNSSHYAQRILLLVSGMSPQIVTETLYALTQASSSAFVPTEIHLVSTTSGAEQARLNLLEGNRQFYRFCRDYDIDDRIFTADNIHIIRDADGVKLADIRTPTQNEAMANYITGLIQQFTTSEDTALHVSLAGGRKTMGHYAGYALSLFGRDQDRLSHVLVSAGYEGLTDFYYPTPESAIIYDRTNKALDTSKATIDLAEIPFVRLRSGLPDNLLAGNASFNRTVQLARLANEPLTIMLNPSESTYSVGADTHKLPTSQMALLLWVAHRRLHNQAPIEPVLDIQYNDDNRRIYASELLAVAEKYWLNLHAKTRDALDDSGVTKSFLESTASRLNASLKDQLGPKLATRCKLASQQSERGSGYDLPDDIDIRIHQDTP